MFLLIVLFVFEIQSLASAARDSCSIVRQQYTDMALGDASHVPFTLQKGGGICRSESGMCCSQAMERNFSKRLKRDYGLATKSYFTRAYEGIKSQSEHFQMSIERYVLHNARISLQSCSLLHSNTSSLPTNTNSNQHVDIYRQRVMNVYSNVTHYFSQVHKTKDVDVRRILKTFAQESMSVKKSRSITCLRRTADKLESALDAAWLIKESLKFGRSLFSSIRSWRPSDTCIEALVEMNYCPLCNPNLVYQLAQPCSKYCVNVQKGCLAPILQISNSLSEWSTLLQTLLSELVAERSLVESVSGLNQFVHGTMFSNRPEDICEHENYVYQDPWGDTLEYHLNRLSQELQLLEDSFDILPYQLCDRMNYNSQPGSEHHCWNGTAMSTYNCHVVDSGLHSPNPTQWVSGDPMLSEQEVRLKEIIAMLYEATGAEPSPTPRVEVDIDSLCWDPPVRDSTNTVENDGESNVSDKRDHDSNVQPLKTSSSSSHFLSLLLALLLGTIYY